MEKTSKYWANIRSWRFFVPLLVLASYALFTFYYMTPSVVHCTTTVYGFGDNTAGPIWGYKSSGGAFLPNKIAVTNFPDGESIYSTISLASLGQRLMYWPLAKLVGPVCGYNLWNILAFLTTSLVMFGFIFWLTRSRWIAWLSGYAVAFVPYMQMKTGPHPSYGFSGILIGILWVMLSLITRPTRHKAILLGGLIAFCAYFDPYFVLYGGLTVLAVLIAWFARIVWLRLIRKTKRTGIRFRKVAKELIIAGLVAGIALAPLVTASIASSKDIQKQVSSVRGNVLAEAAACTNTPQEYLLPFVLHPVAKMFGVGHQLIRIENKLKSKFSCGIGEDTVGVSLTLLLIIFLTGIIVTWEIANKRRVTLDLVDDDDGGIGLGQFVLLAAVILLLLGVGFGLPPTHILGLPTPTKLLLDVTTTWRTLTRSFLLVDIALVTLAAMAIRFYAANKSISRPVKIGAFVFVFAAVFIEYQAFPAFKGNTLSTFSYKTDVPAVYSWLKGQDTIRVIAEYPMESYGESDAPSYYLTMQFIHNKKILNATSPESSMEVFRRSIKNINDPQTLPALAALGVDAVVIHGVDKELLDVFKPIELGGVFAKPRFGVNIHTKSVVDDTSIVVSPKLAYQSRTALIGMLSSGFFRNLGIIKYPDEWAYEAVQGAKIDLKLVDSGSIKSNTSVQPYCFKIRASAPSDVLQFKPVLDGQPASEPITINNEYVFIRVYAKNDIVLNNDKGSNMQITELGCAN